jgi:serine/threonine-protein kinase
MARAKLARLGRYEIAGELGRGAMGVVYKAHDPVLDRTVALKTIALAENEAGRSEYQKRFFQEAKAAARLNHPRLITIYDFGEEGDLAWMAMEMLAGTELRERIAQAPIPVREALKIAEQVADGLGFAHEHGVVHRDIKPGNIMLMPRAQVKIMDFGVARVRVSSVKTQTGTRLGTPKYMSPEQAMGRPADHRSDVFSLGIVLYEMLTRASPFHGSDSTEVMYNVTTQEAIEPSRVNAEVPETLDLVVRKALAKNPDERYRDAYEFASDLQACLAELGERNGAAEPTGGTAPAHGAKPIDAAKPDSDKTELLAPDASGIGAETRLPISRRFDSAAALRRLTEPGARDLRLLTRAPRPVGVSRRVLRDPVLRRFAAAVLIAALAGFAIAFG